MSIATRQLEPLTKRESEQLDSLRGLSALAVVVGHANQVLLAPAYDGLIPWTAVLAQSAVMVFFAMSGFLIGKSISSNRARHAGTFSAKRYLADRVTRIWPPLLLSALLLTLLSFAAPILFPSGSNHFLAATHNALARNAFTFDVRELLGAMVALNGFLTDTPNANGPLWSLSIEVWYYLLAGILALYWSRRKLLAIFLISAVLCLGRRNLSFLCYLPVWWGGFLLQHLHSRGKLPSVRVLSVATVILLSLGAALGARFIVASYAHDPLADSFWLMIAFNNAIGLACCAGLALLLRGRFSVPVFARSTAAYSYTLYIIHVPIQLFLFGVIQREIENSVGRSAVAACGGIAVALCCAIIAAKLVENRALIRSLLRPSSEPVFVAGDTLTRNI